MHLHSPHMLPQQHLNLFDVERGSWDDEIPADAVARPASAADAPVGDFKMIRLGRQVRGHTFQTDGRITLERPVGN